MYICTRPQVDNGLQRVVFQRMSPKARIRRLTTGRGGEAEKVIPPEEQGLRCTAMVSLRRLVLLCRGISQSDHDHGNVVIRVPVFGVFDELVHGLLGIPDISHVVDGLFVFRNIPQLRRNYSTRQSH